MKQSSYPIDQWLEKPLRCELDAQELAQPPDNNFDYFTLGNDA